MKKNTGKEIGYLLLTAIPFLYLALVYARLPETVPTHFDIKGNANGWSTRQSLWLLPACIPLFCYLLLTFLPRIDPRQKLKQHTGKFEHIRFVLVLFMTGIACFAIHLSEQQGSAHTGKFLFAFLGLFFATLGNFMPSLKPNYFIGIRTPWSLENESVWKKTHQLAGKIWVAGGLLIMLLAFIMAGSAVVEKIMLPLILLMAFVPAVYSFFLWRRIKRSASANNR